MVEIIVKRSQRDHLRSDFRSRLFIACSFGFPHSEATSRPCPIAGAFAIDELDEAGAGGGYRDIVAPGEEKTNADRYWTEWQRDNDEQRGCRARSWLRRGESFHSIPRTAREIRN